MSIEAKIRILAKSSDQSLREIASRSDITPSCLSRYFAGKAQLRADAFLRLMNTLGLNLERDLERKISTSVEVHNPTSFDEALVCAYKLLPTLEKRRFLKLLLRHLAASDQSDGRSSVDIVVKELVYASGALELRQEA